MVFSCPGKKNKGMILSLEEEINSSAMVLFFISTKTDSWILIQKCYTTFREFWSNPTLFVASLFFLFLSLFSSPTQTNLKRNWVREAGQAVG
jgi:hypothetical protein